MTNIIVESILDIPQGYFHIHFMLIVFKLTSTKVLIHMP
jgi:hypothetical protein